MALQGRASPRCARAAAPTASGVPSDRCRRYPFVLRSVRVPVANGISKWEYRQFSQSVCPWNVRLASERPEGSPFALESDGQGLESGRLSKPTLISKKASDWVDRDELPNPTFQCEGSLCSQRNDRIEPSRHDSGDETCQDTNH